MKTIKESCEEIKSDIEKKFGIYIAEDGCPYDSEEAYKNGNEEITKLDEKTLSMVVAILQYRYDLLEGYEEMSYDKAEEKCGCMWNMWIICCDRWDYAHRRELGIEFNAGSCSWIH